MRRACRYCSNAAADRTAPASPQHYIFSKPRARLGCRRRKTSSGSGLICTVPKPISSGCGNFPPMPRRRRKECRWDNGQGHTTTPKLSPLFLAPRASLIVSGPSRPRSDMSGRLDVAPGVAYWPDYLHPADQAALLKDVIARVAEAPFYRPTMPGSGRALSVEMTNFGPLGWITDQSKGYRYEPAHPVTGAAWPEIPDVLLTLWSEVTGYP